MVRAVRRSRLRRPNLLEISVVDSEWIQLLAKPNLVLLETPQTLPRPIVTIHFSSLQHTFLPESDRPNGAHRRRVNSQTTYQPSLVRMTRDDA